MDRPVIVPGRDRFVLRPSITAFAAVLGLLAATGADDAETYRSPIRSPARPLTDDELADLDHERRRYRLAEEKKYADNAAKIREERRQRKIAAYNARQPKP